MVLASLNLSTKALFNRKRVKAKLETATTVEHTRSLPEIFSITASLIIDDPNSFKFQITARTIQPVDYTSKLDGATFDFDRHGCLTTHPKAELKLLPRCSLLPHHSDKGSYVILKAGDFPTDGVFSWRRYFLLRLLHFGLESFKCESFKGPIAMSQIAFSRFR